ncbi:MAG: PA14 domain-containing protein, partial [Candidatus Omnitrophica bacterium]|nr:PA14 domain-containing protein [Candidatus Omnitrophota bacterium]
MLAAVCAMPIAGGIVHADPGIPLVVSVPASGVGSTNATLNAIIDTNQVTVTNYFECGPGSTGLSFDGLNDKVAIPHANSLNAYPLTVTAWIKISPGESNMDSGIVNKYYSSSLNGWHLFIRSGQVRAWYIRNNANYVWDGTSDGLIAGSVDDGQWHHVSFVVDASGGRVYVDGTLRASRGWTGTPGAPSTTQPVSLGFYNSYFRGQMDEVTVWNDALTPAELLDLSTNPITPSHPKYSQLRAYWPLDEGSGATTEDASGNGHTGVLSGDIMWAPGCRPAYSATTSPEVVIGTNSVLALDGVDDHVQAPSGVWFNGDLSIEAWVYPRSYNNWSRLIDFGNGPDSDNVLLAFSSGTTGIVRFEVRHGSTAYGLSSPTPLPLNQWSHVACTLGGGTAILYLNGAAWASGTVWSPNSITRSKNYIGRSNWSQNGYANVLYDDIRLWNAALDPGTIRAWMNVPATSAHPNYDALAAEWRFDEVNGDVIVDSSPNHQDAALINGAQYASSTAVSAMLTNLVPGTMYHYRAVALSADGIVFGQNQSFATPSPNRGAALDFDGFNGYARVAATALRTNLPTTEVTVEFWERLHTLKICATFSLEPDQGGNRLLAHVPWGDGIVYWDFGNAGGSGRLTYVPPTSLVGTWHHWAFVSSVSGSYMRIYHNGEPVSWKNGASARSAGNYNLILGQTQGGYFFDGELDEFRLWKVARTEAQIRQNWNARLTGDEPNLVAYYRMDEGAGGVLTDSASQALHGLLVNEPARVVSTSPVSLPVAVTQSPTNVLYGNVLLLGTAKGDGATPTETYFEYGEGLPLEVSYYYIGFIPGSMRDIDFPNRIPDLVSTFSNINNPSIPGALWPSGPADQFAARFTGQLLITNAGTYTFYTSSDDGSLFYLDGQLVVNNDGGHGTEERNGRVDIEEGNHPFVLEYFEEGGPGSLVLSYTGPGISKQVIPPSVFTGAAPDYQKITDPQILPVSLEATPVINLVTNLYSGTTYHYRMVASNTNGASYGANRDFTMPFPGPLWGACLDGRNDYILTPNLRSAFPNETVTIELWFLANAAGIIVDERALANLSTWYDSQIEILSNGEVRVRVWQSPLLIFGSVAFGTWNHVVLRYDRTAKVLDGFLNGVESANKITNLDRDAPWESSSSYGIYYGFGLGDSQNLGSGAYLNGQIDEVRIWNTARSASEIQDNMHRRLNGDEAGLVAYYRFDEGSGSMAVDYGTNHFNATLVNGAFYAMSGAEITFPLVTTQPATPVLATKATLNGLANPCGDDTVAYYQWGQTADNLDGKTPFQSVGSGQNYLAFAHQLEDLEPGTAYYYRLVAYNQAGTNYGSTLTFTTPVFGYGWPVSTKITGGESSSPSHAVDTDGNVYLAGLFSGSANFRSTLTAAGGSSSNAFVAKLNKGGDWLWATNIPLSAGGFQEIRAISVDAERNVYIAGQFSGLVRMGADLNAGNNTNLFVAKLNRTGDTWLWAQAVGGAGIDRANALAAGTNGNLYLAGQFAGTATFGTNTLSSSNGTPDILVAKLDAAGNWLWARAACGSGVNDAANTLVTDSEDNVYLAGQFGNSVGFGSYSLSARGDTDLFVAKLNTDGTWLVAKRGGGSGTDAGLALAIDNSGQLYLLGQFSGTADYDGSWSDLNTGTAANLFLLKLTSQGIAVWYAQGGAGNGASAAVDAANHVYVTGDFSVTTQWGTQSLISSGSTDVFIAQLETGSGVCNWIRKIGAQGTEQCGSASVDASGMVTVSGSYQSTILIGYVQLVSNNPKDIFLARLDATPRYEYNTWTIGQPVPIPPEAQSVTLTNGGAIGQPMIVVLEQDYQDSDNLNSFDWSLAESKLYGVRPVTAIVKWPLTTEATNTTKVITVVGRTIWPVHPQFHVAGAPVEVQPAIAGFPYQFFSVAFTSINGADVDPSKIFNASSPGYSVIKFLTRSRIA